MDLLVEALIAVVVLLYLYHLWARGYWKRRNVITAEGGEYFFGHTRELILFKKNGKDFFHALYTKNKDKKMVGFYNIFEPMLLVMDPELIMNVLVADFQSFTDQPFSVKKKLEPMLSLNPFVAKGLDKWKHQRGIHTAMQTQARLKEVTPTITNIGQIMINYVKEKKSEPILVAEFTKYYTFDVLSATAYGLEPSAFTDPENIFRKHANPTLFSNDIDKAFMYSTFLPLINEFLSLRMISEEKTEFFIEMTKSMVDFRKKSKITRNDYIDHLLKLEQKQKAEGKEGFSNAEFAGHLLTAFVDAVETSSTVLSFLLLELANHPEIQDRLREDILAVGKEPEDFDYEKVHSIEYLTMVFNEILRLHPLLMYFSRECTKTTKLGGAEIKKGTKIFIPYNSIVNDTEYFSNPDEFDPERFSKENTMARTKGTFYPFGEGPRQCLGMKYAQLQIKLAVVYLLIKFKLLPPCQDTIGKKVEDMDKITFLQTPKEGETIIFQPL